MPAAERREEEPEHRVRVGADLSGVGEYREVDANAMTDTQTTVGVVAESGADERRVALVPKAIAPLVKSGIAVVVESGAGERALLPDELYTEAGATIGDAWSADVVVKVAPPTTDEVGKLHSGQTLIGFLAPRNAENSIGALEGRPACRRSPWRRSRVSRVRRPWTRCRRRATSPDTRRCCWPRRSPPGSSRC